MENKKAVKKPSPKTLSLSEVKDLIKFMKQEQVASFSFGELAVNFHPMAFINKSEVNNQGQTTHKATNQPEGPIDDPLYDAVE